MIFDFYCGYVVYRAVSSFRTVNVSTGCGRGRVSYSGSWCRPLLLHMGRGGWGGGVDRWTLFESCLV